MATVYKLLPTAQEFYGELQERADFAENERHKRVMAVLLLQRMARGYLIRKHIAWLSKNAIVIQCAFRVHMARKAYSAALRRAVRTKHANFYARAAKRIQALWRGHYSRRTKFCYLQYRRWLATVKERGDRRAAEALEFGIRSRADDLRILEEEARTWLAFVVFKLHHLLRTFVTAGIYSDPKSHELSEFEILLKSIHYTEYMKRLKRKYDEFVRKHRPRFSNKRLFPIIGDGADYWYLSLAEMYELTNLEPEKKMKDTRHMDTHHGSQHKQPFLWKKVRPPAFKDDRGPFEPQLSIKLPPTPDSTKTKLKSIDGSHKDPRFYLYVKHYTPQPALFDYVDFHINALLARKYSVENVNVDSNLCPRQ